MISSPTVFLYLSRKRRDIDFDIHVLTAIGLTPGGSSTVHIYTQTIHRTTTITTLTQLTTLLAFWDSNPEWSN